MSVGAPEILLVLVIALLVFGPKRLPEMGRQLGRTVREFRKAAETARRELGLDEVISQVNDVKTDLTSSMGLDEITSAVSGVKDGVSGVTSDLGLDTITGGVSDVKDSLSLKGLGKAVMGGGAAATVTGSTAATTDAGAPADGSADLTAGDGAAPGGAAIAAGGDGHAGAVTPQPVGEPAVATAGADQSDPASWPACD